MKDEKRHVVYFIGAGLTKSLEIAPNRIPLMTDFISVMADYLDDETVLKTLLELENAALFEWTRPEWQVLAKVISERRKKDQQPTDDQIKSFQRIMKSRPAEDIERILERSFDKHDNLSAELSPRRFNFAINKVFARIGWNVNWSPLDKFLGRQFGLFDSCHTFISFNYDLVLERCVQKQARTRWSPHDGYGFKAKHYLTPEGATAHMGQFQQGFGSYSPLDARPLPLDEADANIAILKPHGSLNWLVPFGGNYKFSDETPVLSVTDSLGMTYSQLFSVDEVALTQSDMPKSSLGIFVIPPTRSKSRDLSFILEIREREKQALLTADEVYVMGWSMPATDHDQECLIRSHIGDRMVPVEKVTIINMGQAPEYFDRIADAFSVDRSKLEVHNAGFAEFVSCL